MADMKSAAARISQAANNLMVEDLEPQPANAREFGWLDLGFYDSSEAALVRLRYRKLGDYELAVLTRQNPRYRTFIRSLVSSEESVRAGIYHLCPRGWGKWLNLVSGSGRNIRAVEFDTEFSDGHFLATGNCGTANPFAPPPSIHTLHLPLGSDLREVLKTHEERLSTYLAEHTTVKPLVIGTSEERDASNKRMRRLQAEFRRGKGGITKNELLAIAGGARAEQAEAVYKEIDTKVGVAAGVVLEPPSKTLQFDEPGSSAAPLLVCSSCTQPVVGSYYTLDDRFLCTTCRSRLGDSEGSLSWTPFWRALGRGSLAALAGSALYYAVLALTGYQVGLIAVVVGFLVGNAVRQGSGGNGGRRYQTLAVFLTYCAIVLTYVPLIASGLKENLANAKRINNTRPVPSAPLTNTARPPSSLAISDKALPPPGAPATQVSPPILSNSPSQPSESVRTTDRRAIFQDFLLRSRATHPTLRAVAVVGVSLIAAAVLVLAIPFLGGIHNLMGLFIIGIALWEAWKLNRPSPRRILGPFAVGQV